MLSKLHTDHKGFTLIELLVVILIIAILAVIAVPAFLAQRAKAQDASAKSLVRQAQTALETHWQSNNTYATATAASLKLIEPSLATGGGPSLSNPTSLTTTGYRVSVTSRSTNSFTITRVGGAVTRSCSRPNQGGSCRSTLLW